VQTLPEAAETAALPLRRSCHPSVTPDAREKGCKRPVHRRSGTLAPFNEKNRIIRFFIYFTTTLRPWWIYTPLGNSRLDEFLDEPSASRVLFTIFLPSSVYHAEE